MQTIIKKITGEYIVLIIYFSFSGVLDVPQVGDHELHEMMPVGAVTAATLAANCQGAQNISSNPQSSNGGGSGSSGRSTPNNLSDQTAGKLFVGGLSWQTSADKLREYFGMFGTVTDVLIMKDPITQVSKLFWFQYFI